MYEDITCRHGCPQEVLSDNGSHLRNALLNQLPRIMAMLKNWTSPYRPQAIGQTERGNQTFLNMISMFADELKQNWDTYIPS